MNKLELCNFKCFVNNQIEFKNFTVFTGVNAAGKSTVIQSLLLYDAAAQKDSKDILDISDILGIDIGSPKNLVSQNARNFGGGDFRIGVDDIAVDFMIDRENGLDVYVKKGELPGTVGYLLSECGENRAADELPCRRAGTV